MPIRHATLDDLPALMALGQRFFEFSEYGRFVDFDAEGALAAAQRFIEGAGVVLVGGVDGKVVGGACGMLSRVWFAPSAVAAVELAWWVDPSARGTVGVRLLRAFEDWARGQGANVVVLSDMVMRGREPASALITKLGYSQVERSHFKEV